ncbi:tyrosine-type recombinase/integrase [Hwanghaeella sp.]|uniref:tyrosine-type recombinase/integrase n=1 Tax=Hwanghaeella sp. TaxID=2605943 RepID=UPI003CCC4303
MTNFCDMTGKNGTRYGERRFAQLEPKHLRAIRDNMTDRPEAANSIIKGLRVVFRCAKERDIVSANPAAEVPLLQSKNKAGHHSWTLEEVEKFEQTHPVGSKARLALALFLYTSQRRGDVVRMGRQHVRNEWLFVKQEKTGVELHIPIVRQLRAIIDASPTGDLTFLVTDFNKPFTSNGFGNRMRKWCDEAGLPHCSAHGLRKASAVRLAEDGCTDLEIMSWGGWKTLAEVQRYTKGARQRFMAAAARDKIDR